MKKTIYAVSREYLPTIQQADLNSFFGRLQISGLLFWRPSNLITEKSISTTEILSVANRPQWSENGDRSGNPEWLVCDSLKDATLISAMMLKAHNTDIDYMTPGISSFASPVVFKFEIESSQQDAPMKTLNAETLANYPDTSRIPLHYDVGTSHDRICAQQNKLDMVQEELKKIDPAFILPKFRMQETKVEPSAAYYIAATGGVYESKLYTLPGLNYIQNRLQI